MPNPDTTLAMTTTANKLCEKGQFFHNYKRAQQPARGLYGVSEQYLPETKRVSTDGGQNITRHPVNSENRVRIMFIIDLYFGDKINTLEMHYIPSKYCSNL